jgi:outer membrane immunogenic protein
MKKLFTALAVMATLTAAPVKAADLPSIKAPPPVYVPPAFTWTGFYAGLNIGGGWLDGRSDSFFGGGNDRGGVVGGGQIGFNYQLSPLFVVGLETDFQGTSIGSGSNNNNFFFFAGNGFGAFDVPRVEWFGTVRGRLGVTPFGSHILVYGTGGFAYGEVRRTFFDGFGAFGSGNDVQTGWTAGGGVEWAFTQNWTVKVEYLHTELERNNDNGFFLNTAFLRRHTRFETVRLGVNYLFNWGAPAPVLAKF